MYLTYLKSVTTADRRKRRAKHHRESSLKEKQADVKGGGKLIQVSRFNAQH